MVTSITPILKQHTPRAQVRVGDWSVYVTLEPDAYLDSTTSATQLAKQTHARPHVAITNGTDSYHRNQQYSVTAITTVAGAIAERYAYTAYGLPTILNASATIIAASAISNCYTYTGREWDATLSLHHFRARWMSPIAGRFLGRDPMKYSGSPWNFYEFVNGLVMSRTDPTGLIQDGGVDNNPDTINCDRFLQLIPTLDPKRWPKWSRAAKALDRGPHIFCGDCGAFQNYSFKGRDGQCHICLSNKAEDGSPLEFYQGQWIGSLVHELVHCDQFQCGKSGSKPSLGNPISPTDPDWVPPKHKKPSKAECSTCETQEEHAYDEQCRLLHPKDLKKRDACIKAGVCYSCMYVCGRKEGDCPPWPEYVP